MVKVQLLVAVLLLCVGGVVRAGTDFRDSITQGDRLRGAGKFAEAIEEFKVAATQAGNATDTGIALAKQGEVQAFNLKDYAAALALADQVIALTDAHAVAKVTAMRVKAECLMKQAQRDLAGAQAVLKEALSLEGVDWARPGLTLALGDAQRFNGEFETAIATFKSVLDLESANDAVKGVAWLNMGLVHQYSLKNAGQAKSDYASAVKLNPGLQYEVDKHLAQMK